MDDTHKRYLLMREQEVSGALSKRRFSPEFIASIRGELRHVSDDNTDVLPWVSPTHDVVPGPRAMNDARWNAETLIRQLATLRLLLEDKNDIAETRTLELLWETERLGSMLDAYSEHYAKTDRRLKRAEKAVKKFTAATEEQRIERDRALADLAQAHKDKAALQEQLDSNSRTRGPWYSDADLEPIRIAWAVDCKARPRRGIIQRRQDLHEAHQDDALFSKKNIERATNTGRRGNPWISGNGNSEG